MAVAPYDSLSTILDATRTRVNDAIAGLGGDVLKNIQPFTQQYTNTAWRKFQEFLANLGIVRLKREVIIASIPIVTSIDPASQVSLAWDGFFDGTTLQPSPVLPQDLIIPLKMWERVSGQNAPFCTPPLENFLDGLPTLPKQASFVGWEWREDKIFICGSQQVEDLRIRYAAYLPDFVDNSPLPATPWYNQKVPMMRCLDALSWYIAYDFCAARGDGDAPTLKANAEEAAKLIMNRDIQMKQRTNVRRQPRSGRFQQFGYGYGTNFV